MTLLLDPAMKPFVFFAALVVGLLLLEVIFMFIGLDTRIGSDSDFDVDAGFESDMADLDADVAEFEAEMAEADADAETSATDGASGGGFLDLIGLRKLPMTVWLALFSAFFAGIGMAGQTAVWALLGLFVPPAIAVVLVLPVALVLTGLFAELVSNWIPREESWAISERSYGRRKGVVTVGVARRGSPAQVRFTDHHGNMHYVMAEPMSDDDAIEQGTEVLIVRLRNGDLRLVRVS